jgi:hypothetical protein
MFSGAKVNANYDSIEVAYTSDQVQNFYAYSSENYLHLRIDYYTKEEMLVQNNRVWNNYDYIFVFGYNYTPREPSLVIKSTGQYNRAGERIGEWLYYTTASEVCKSEMYFIPTREEEKEEMASIK